MCFSEDITNVHGEIITKNIKKIEMVLIDFKNQYLHLSGIISLLFV